MAGKVTTVEQKIARIAEDQYGVATRAELRAAGISDDQIDHRIEIGALIPEYSAVYRVGHPAPSVEAQYLAAVKACGDGAVLSGRAAGYFLSLLKDPPPPPEVTAPKRRRIKGLRPRVCRHLDPRDITVVRGIPVTTVPRTLVDLAADLSLDELARAFHEAGFHHRTTPRQVKAVLARRPTSPGARKVRLVMGSVPVALSKLEAGFLKLLKKEGLPLPITNKPAGGYRVDCRWPEYRLTVELDSFQAHNSRYSWERDRLREREAYARGDQFRRYTWRDVFEDPRQMLRELRELLA